MKAQDTSGTAGGELPASAEEPGAEREKNVDLVVIGAGVAGLRAAIEASSSGLRVLILSKEPPRESNTGQAQGGVAAALSGEDDVGLHQRDTVAAGAGLCDERAVRTLVGEGPGLVEELIGWGARFDREGALLAFGREGAHSVPRVLHAGGDSTGQEILRALLEHARLQRSITFLDGAFTVGLETERGRCAGAIVLETGTGRIARLAGRVLLATGGCGQVFRETTNPSQATGDGIAMAWQAGAWVRDMEFVQFHPTALAVAGAPRFLLSEALRGEGGILRDAEGTRFMPQVDPRRAELAPRDIVARAIANRMAETGKPHVLLDMTLLDAGLLRRRFPRIHTTCLGLGIDITRDPIPVSPCAHYMMGGVATDLDGRTSVPGLYAAGEVACSGVHGANRLASNSLLEGLVFGARAARAVLADLKRESRGFDPALGEPLSPAPGMPVPGRWPDAVARERAVQVREAVQEIAWTGTGLVRSAEGLLEALRRLDGCRDEAPGGEPTRPGVESRNLHLVATLIAHAALARRESRGAHYREDYPETDDRRFRKWLIMRCGGEMLSLRPRREGAGP